MLNKSDYNSWMNAFKLKDALVETNQRSNPGMVSSASENAQLSGYYNLSPTQRANIRIPLFTQDNQVFGQSSVKGEEKSPMVKADIKKGSIVEYQSENGSEFGIIIDAPIFASQKGAYIKKIKRNQAEKILEKNKNVPKITLDKKSLQNLKPKPGFWQIIKIRLQSVKDYLIFLYLIIIILGLGYIFYKLINS